MTQARQIRVMLVDDSTIVRGLMQRALARDAEITIVATAVDGQMAIDTLKRTATDILILDVEMPVMDGLTALPALLKVSPDLKVIMSSTLTLRNAEVSLRALQLGAVDYLAKPTASKPDEVEEFYRQLIGKIKALAPVSPTPVAQQTIAPPNTPVAHRNAVPPVGASLGITPVVPGNVVPLTTVQEALAQAPRASAIAIASSTGGPQALLTVFAALKGRVASVPIFITQHMPATFTKILAEHISRAVGSDCHEGRDGEVVRAGVIYLAPGDYHMTVERQGASPTIRLNQNPPENFCRPSADPMLRSLAQVYGGKLLSLAMTGMGGDGAAGAAEVVKAGGTVAAQNEATCVVYGMPRAVVDHKLARAILPLDQVAPYIARAMGA